MGLKLLVLRHALAGDREAFRAQSDKPDEMRPLEKEGRKQMRRDRSVIKKMVPKLDLILTSPYVRAYETAVILAKVYPKATLVEIEELNPLAAVAETLRYLKQLKSTENVAIVGHQPHLGDFLSFVLTGTEQTIFDMKKGAFAIVKFREEIEKKRAELICFIQPSQVEKIREK